MPDPLTPTSDRPRWETDPAPDALAEVLADELDALGFRHDNDRRCRALDCADALADLARDHRAALVGWLIASGIATQPTVMLPDGFDGFPAVYADPSDPALNGCIDVWGTTENIPANLARPLFLLDGAP